MNNTNSKNNLAERANQIFTELVSLDQCKKVLARLKKMEVKLNANIKVAGDGDAAAMSSAYDRLATLRFLIKKTEESIKAIETGAEDYVLAI